MMVPLIVHHFLGSIGRLVVHRLLGAMVVPLAVHHLLRAMMVPLAVQYLLGSIACLVVQYLLGVTACLVVQHVLGGTAADTLLVQSVLGWPVVVAFLVVRCVLEQLRIITSILIRFVLRCLKAVAPAVLVTQEARRSWAVIIFLAIHRVLRSL